LVLVALALVAQLFVVGALAGGSLGLAGQVLGGFLVLSAALMVFVSFVDCGVASG